MKEQLEQKQMDYSRGKIAGHDVRDNDHNLIVPQGDMITDEHIQKAREKGKLHYLMLAAASTVIAGGDESTRERLREFRDITEGHEEQFVLGEIANRDVKDFQGDMIVARGETITDEHIQKAREKGILQELVLAVGASGAHMGMEEEAA